MNACEVVEQLFAACRIAGVDAEMLFEHFDRADIDAYRQALAEGWIPAASLPRWMSCAAETIASGRCLCRKCKAVAA